MKKIFKIFPLGLIIFCSFTLLVSAEVAPITKVSQAIVISDINVTDAKVVSQDGNKINLSFRISNNEGSQAGLKYGVKLIKNIAYGQLVVDDYVSSESFSLSPKTSIIKEFTYVAPANLGGEYLVVVTLNNSNGVMGRGLAGKVKLISTINSVEFLPESCSLSVKNEKGNPKYNLTQGVDISSTEELSLTCIVINASKNSITAIPVYETHLRNLSGNVVEHTGGDVAPITFKSGDKKSIPFTLPKATKPQAYDVKVSLKDGENISNSIIIHYVIRGLSATIQNLSLDKDYYERGDNANLSVYWSPSADSFTGNRAGLSGTSTKSMSLSINISNDKGSKCIKTLDQAITNTTSGEKINIPLSITSKCKNPTVSLDLKDAEEKVLDHKEVTFNTKVDDSKDKSQADSKNNSIIYIIIGLVALIAIAIYIINLKKKSNETIPQ